MKKFISIIIVITLIAAVAYALVTNKEEKQQLAALAQEKNTEISVITKKVSLGAISDDITATGYFEPFREIILSSEVQGRVQNIYVKEGDFVQSGNIIVQLDSADVMTRYRSSLANLNKTKKDLDRFALLEPKGGVTKQQLDEVSLAYQSAASNIESIREQIAKTTIRAPFSGTVNNKFVERGTFLSPGSQVIEIVDISTLKIVVTLSEKEVIKVSEGMTVQIKADAIPGADFEGRVTFIGVKANDALRYPVQVTLKNSSRTTLKAGMFGSVSFTFPEREEVLIIPREAIAGSIKSPKVFLVKDGKVILKDIKLGTASQSTLEVTGGLALNDEIVIDGQINLEDGDSVITSQKQ